MKYIYFKYLGLYTCTHVLHAGKKHTLWPQTVLDRAFQSNRARKYQNKHSLFDFNKYLLQITMSNVSNKNVLYPSFESESFVQSLPSL